ncbi:MAG: family 20 glycosylhydrolase [Hominisplanchenecus sp.]
MRKRKTLSKVTAWILVCCMLLFFPGSMKAVQAEEGTSFVPTRIFIDSGAGVPEEELCDKVTLAASEFVAKGICRELPVVYGDGEWKEAGDLVVSLNTVSEKSESAQEFTQDYEIRMEHDMVFVSSECSTGILYGLRDVLKSLILGKSITAKIQAMDVSQRIFHLDCGRKYFSKEWLIALIRELSWLEMNQLELDFSNGTGFRFALDDMTLDVNGVEKDLSVLPGGTTDSDKWLTESEMDEILAAADQYGVEIVPCLDTPGHTGWIVSKPGLTEYAGNGEIDVENENSVAFAKALVKKYAAYFLSRGCTTFHIGGDEYLHGYYNWGTPMPSTEGKYGAVATYLDGLAGELKEMGYRKVRAFNDPLYYAENLTTHQYQNIDEAEYWCRRMSGFNYASPTTLADQGLHMLNGHGDFYDIMTDDNWQKPVGDAGTKKTPAGIYAQFRNTIFAGSVQMEPDVVYGSTYFLWCDNAGGGDQKQVTYSLYPRLRAAAEKMRNEDASGTWEAFAADFTDSAGGFLADGSLQTAKLPDKPEAKPVITQDQKAANEVIEKIQAIGTVTELSVVSIKAAREAYEALTPQQKLLVDQTVIDKLEQAEKELAKIFEKKYDLSGAQFGTIPVLEYRGQPLTPAFTVVLDGKTLVKDRDYTVSFQNNRNIGRAAFTVSGMGDYTGTLSGSFWITISGNREVEVGNCRYIVKNPAVDGSGSVAFAGVVKPVSSVKIGAKVNIGGVSFQVTEITAKAMQKDKKLTSITIGENIRKIGKNAFYGCSRLKKITIKSGKLTSGKVGSKAFGKLSSRVTVKVPKNKRVAYRKFLVKKGITNKEKIK